MRRDSCQTPELICRRHFTRLQFDGFAVRFHKIKFEIAFRLASSIFDMSGLSPVGPVKRQSGMYAYLSVFKSYTAGVNSAQHE